MRGNGGFLLFECLFPVHARIGLCTSCSIFCVCVFVTQLAAVVGCVGAATHFAGTPARTQVRDECNYNAGHAASPGGRSDQPSLVPLPAGRTTVSLPPSHPMLLENMRVRALCVLGRNLARTDVPSSTRHLDLRAGAFGASTSAQCD